MLSTPELERPAMRPAAATKPYALIVEDEPALVELLRYNLIKEGYEVAIATDGEEALLTIEERQPDIVLLDWMLPKLAGIEVARRISAPRRPISGPGSSVPYIRVLIP